MKIRMVVDISGTRDGVAWPPRGSVMDLPDVEAISYVSSGMAVPVPTFNDAETATLPAAEERASEPAGLRGDSPSGEALKRGPGRPRKTT